MPADSTVDGLITDLLSILCILNELFLHFHVGGEGGSLNGFEFGTFIGCFASGGMASVAVKG